MKSNKWLTPAAVGLCTATVFAFWGLTPIGVWIDEYSTLGAVRDQGLRFIYHWFFSWSPRPFSDMLIWFYGLVVMHVNKPLIAEALFPCWLLLTLFLLIPSTITRRGFVASFALLALFLLGHKVAQVFYWPIGAFAYMPTLAGIGALLALDFAGYTETKNGRVFALVALLMAATSSEIGAVFSAGYCILGFMASSYTHDRLRAHWVIPFATSLIILAILYTGRVETNSEVLGHHSINLNFLDAVRLAIAPFFRELIGTDIRQQSTIFILSEIASKIAFFVAVYLIFSKEKQVPWERGQLMRLALATALLGANFIVIAASYYHFGELCCERHATMRQCFVFIALGSLALFAGRTFPIRSEAIGTILLIVSIALPLATAAPNLLADYRDSRTIIDARNSMWKSGQAPGSSMTVKIVPAAHIAGGFPFPPPGRYTEGQGGIFVNWLMHYFGKKSVDFQASSSSDNSDRSKH